MLALLRRLMGWLGFGRGRGITLLVPYTAGSCVDRDRAWGWLKAYWRQVLPGVRIVMGTDEGRPFSKTTAVNGAASRAKGDVWVILDADAYLDSEVILNCAREIRLARKQGRRLWFVPYRRLHRLTPRTTKHILASPPVDSLGRYVDSLGMVAGEGTKYGHHFAAMAMVLPREAFEESGGMDPRFRGWGGEDVSFMHQLDTIYGSHKSTNNAVLHFHHPAHGAGLKRRWPGQARPNPFGQLGLRYRTACGDRARMQRLVAEWREA